MQGPGGIYKGDYDPTKLTQDQRNWLYNQFGNSGVAPVGYGGQRSSTGETGAWGNNQGYQGASTAPGQTPTSGPSGASAYDPVAAAKQIAQFTAQQNAPAISALGSAKTDLQSRYDDLLASIKAGSQVGVNQQTLVTARELGNRGILPTSTLYGQEMTNALLPVNATYAGLNAQTGLAAQQDINQLMAQIGLLQAGNPESAANMAANILAASRTAIPAGGQIYNALTGSLSGGGNFQLSSPSSSGNSTTTSDTTPSWTSSVNQIDWGDMSTGAGGINATSVPASFWTTLGLGGNLFSPTSNPSAQLR